jgi:hypothetical protein
MEHIANPQKKEQYRQQEYVKGIKISESIDHDGFFVGNIKTKTAYAKIASFLAYCFTRLSTIWPVSSG